MNELHQIVMTNNRREFSIASLIRDAPVYSSVVPGLVTDTVEGTVGGHGGCNSGPGRETTRAGGRAAI